MKRFARCSLVFAFIFNRVFPNMFAYALRYRHYLIVHAWAFFECADRLRVHVRATAHQTRAHPAQYFLLVLFVYYYKYSY